VQNSYAASLSSALPASAIQNIANHFGTSERTILDGVQSSIAAVVSGLSQRSGDRGFLSQIMQLASATPENAVASALSNGSLTNPASTFLTGGAQFLSTVFGSRLGGLTETLSNQTGLRPRLPPPCWRLVARPSSAFSAAGYATAVSTRTVFQGSSRKRPTRCRGCLQPAHPTGPLLSPRTRLMSIPSSLSQSRRKEAIPSCPGSWASC
jgi:Bacterial protein of unknown function (DUF937)